MGVDWRVFSMLNRFAIFDVTVNDEIGKKWSVDDLDVFVII